jgi:hypothetical protein
MITKSETLSLKTVRRNCLECSGGSARHVLWCSCDGHNSTNCEFWAFRFGKRPATLIDKHGPYLLTPEIMPHADVDLEGLPSMVSAASEWLRDNNPQIEWAGPRERTPEEIERAEAARARMNTVRQNARNSAASPEPVSLETGSTPLKPR